MVPVLLIAFELIAFETDGAVVEGIDNGCKLFGTLGTVVTGTCAGTIAIPAPVRF